jgi:hypothetical protein
VKQSLIRKKSYHIADSPFYKLKGRGQLAELLGIDLRDVPALTALGNYRVFYSDERLIQAPINALHAVHVRIASLLARIAVPRYVYSQRGRSHVDNAAQHCGPHPLVKADIHKFYPSTTREMVLRLFVEDFKCASDVAHILADICCFERLHLPTGSTISGYVAFLAAKPLFDAVNELATSVGCTMTLFVDDIAISGPAAGMDLLIEVRRLIRSWGLTTRARKCKVYSPSAPKKLTGAVVTPDGLRLLNRHHLNMHITRRQLASAPAAARSLLKARLNGQLRAARQVLERASEAVLGK